MLPELTIDEFAATLDDVAETVLERLPSDEPPVDALALAQAWQLTVAWDERQTGRGRFVRLREFSGTASRGSILLRPDPRPERLQWVIAHEMGELFAVQVFDRLGVDPREAPPGARENVANQLAGRLLLPKAWYGPAGVESGWDLPQLKARFSTASHELIARRMLDFPPQVAITIFDQCRRTFRRGNLPLRLPPLASLEQAAWLAAHETGEPVTQSDCLCRVQAWPVHEAEWKREILRTQWHAYEDASLD